MLAAAPNEIKKFVKIPCLRIIDFAQYTRRAQMLDSGVG